MAIDADEVARSVRLLRSHADAEFHRAADLLEQLANGLNQLQEWVRKKAAASTITLGEPRAFHVVDEVERRLDRVAEKARKIHDECDD
jgi:hypothetical protein